jgi:hypothetical protein
MIVWGFYMFSNTIFFQLSFNTGRFQKLFLIIIVDFDSLYNIYVNKNESRYRETTIYFDLAKLVVEQNSLYHNIALECIKNSAVWDSRVA